MATITSNFGLITGLPIIDTVDQLIAVQARPRDLLLARSDALRQEQIGVTEINALLLSVQFTAKNLADSMLFQQRTVSTSNAGALAASVNGTPALGTTVFTPLKTAQSHQLISEGIASDTDPLGGGSLTFRFGGFVDEAASLDLLGGGAGLARGKIRITDRSGASAEIDLRFAQTVDDVLDVVNNAADINIAAEAVGDRFRLVDQTGQTTSNLKVQEVGTGTTAASLGLSGIDVAANQADGTDVLRLFDGIRLEQLNDGNGVELDEVLTDLQVQFRDGTTRSVDFRPLNTTTLYAAGTTTAANGINAQATFTAATTGTGLEGVSVIFENDDNVTAGNETVDYDNGQKTLTFKIDEGNTTAAQVIAALNNDATASGFFTASAVGDGSGVIDVNDTATTALTATTPSETTLGDVLDTLNAVAPSKLKAALSADGDRIELTDLTSGAGSFQITTPNNSPALDALGLTAAAVGGVITGRRLLGGLKSTLLASLGGGAGLGTLGSLDLTDRSGANDTVDLSTAETLDDVVAAINAAGVSVLAEVNDARNGIRLTDTSGGSASSFIVANTAATALNIAIDDTATTVNSGDLSKQVVSRGTLLSKLNGGAGITKGSFRVTNSDGGSFAIDLSDESIKTVGDVIDKINNITTGVDAQINETGDGILLIDSVEGTGTLKVEELGGSTAAELHLLGDAVSAQVGGETKNVIDGSTTFTVQLDSDDTLSDLLTKINDLAAGVAASQFNDGSAVNPFRLSLASQRTGKAGELLIDASDLGLSFLQSAAAQDARLLFGSPNDAVVGVVATSSTNQFAGLVPGIDLTVNAASASPVTVTVESTDSNLVATAIALVDGFNALQDKLDSLTFFDAEQNTAGILQGDGTALRVEADLSRFLSGVISGAGSLQSLESLGISLTDDGRLTLDQSALQAKFAADPDAVESFFTTDETGFAARFDELVEQLAGEDNSLLASRLSTLDRRVLDNEARIEFLNERLDRSRERLLEEFFRLEVTLGRIQSNLSAIQSITPIAPLVST